MMTEAEVQAYLDDNGYPPHVVAAGIEGLLNRWRAFATEVEAGYPHRLQDYRHDLDLRGVLEMAGLAGDLEDTDRRFAALLTAHHVRVWESAAAESWWDFGYPHNAGPDLLRDLKQAGLYVEE